MKKTNHPLTAAIILSAGTGSRMHDKKTKQRLKIGEKTVLRLTLEAFSQSQNTDLIVVVTRPDEIDFVKEEIFGLTKNVSIVLGGENRQESAKRGVLSVSDTYEFVAIHDGARCLISPKDIDEVIRVAWEVGAASAVRPVTDTVKLVSEEKHITKTIPRAALYFAETPQVFSTALYQKAIGAYRGALSALTDDNMLFESLGIPIQAVTLSEANPKLTYPEDILFMELMLERKRE